MPNLMPNYWLIMMSEDNYQYTIKNNIYGLTEGLSRLKDSIKLGDRLVIYVVKKGCREFCQSFTAVLEVTGGWRRSSKPTWPDEVNEGKILYPWIINVKVIVTGRISFNSIKDELSKAFSKSIKNPSELRIYMNKKLPGGIGELIEGKLRSALKAMEAVKRGESSHDELIKMVKDIGEWLGLNVKAEYFIDNFRVDAAFFKPPRTVPYAVVEVHVGGDVYKDLASLKHAYDKYGSRLIYIMAKDEDAVVRLVNEAMEGAFHEVRNQLIVIKANQLRRLHEALDSEAVRKLINALIG